jgi:hypothetical protein
MQTRKLKMIETVKIAPSLSLVVAPAGHSMLFFVMIGLAAASLVADCGLLIGAVVIH